MNYLDFDDIYGLIKGCTYDYPEEKKWKIILGKGFRKFDDYHYVTSCDFGSSVDS